MINKERVQFLIDALRSDEFRQGEGALEYIDHDGVAKNCCLGVACRIAQRHGLEMGSDYTNDGLHQKVYFESDSDGSAEVLPIDVQYWYGFGENDPMLKHQHQEMFEEESEWSTATELNDGEHYPFDKIAEAFELTFLTE